MIACDIHDYIEITCLYRIRVALTLKNGQVLDGIGTTTKTESMPSELNNPGLKRELLCFMLTHTPSGTMGRDESVEVDLMDILSMEALEENRHFSRIEF
ncbi:Rho-binding antiterminator [Enterovibrio norvegicus]|uniref:Rho-binding antiterminator n=1 Tax=Enterovibrio norvegicus TaxID=188144 RepID=UPI0013CF81CD|nr:Rho-binding antiterminator [Enterovibrio norvegicus]